MFMFWSITSAARQNLLHGIFLPMSALVPLLEIATSLTWGKLLGGVPTGAPHSQWDSVICKGNRSRSRTTVLNTSGCNTNSGPVGAPQSTALAPGPE